MKELPQVMGNSSAAVFSAINFILDFSAFYAAGFKTITLNITRCDSGGCYTVNGSRKIGKTGTYEIKLNSESNVKFGTRSQTASNIQGNYTAY